MEFCNILQSIKNCRIYVKNIILFFILFDLTNATKSRTLWPIILDDELCPSGWTYAGTSGMCIQLFFEARQARDAQNECRKSGAELIQLHLNKEDEVRAVLSEISSLINEAIGKSVSEFTWIIGRVERISNIKNKNRKINDELRFMHDEIDVHYNANAHFALRKKQNDIFEIIEINLYSAHPFICALSPLKKKLLIYEQALLPKGAPTIFDEPSYRVKYYHKYESFQPNYDRFFNNSISSTESLKTHFVRLPCRASGNPEPHIQWHSAENGENINTCELCSKYLISGGTLFINTSVNFNIVTSYYCTATNKYGTVRSSTFVVRPIFVNPFRPFRVDVFPLGANIFMSNKSIQVRTSEFITTGTRIECDAPEHYPKSYSFLWVKGLSNEQFIVASKRIFISMDGTLYFAFNMPEDANRYSCILALPSTQSAQRGPFFRLILPQFQDILATSTLRPQPFSPQIDEYQPKIFPEFPLQGDTVYIECFAYGYPLPSYKWSRADTLQMSNRHHTINFGRVLRIDRVELKDAVRYKCTSKNELGRASTEIQLIIQTPPSILRPLINKMAAENESVIFNCNMQDGGGIGISRIRSTIEWFHNGEPLVPLLMSRTDRKRIKIYKKELRIYNIKSKDEGIYQCIVKNTVSAVSTSALLFVQNIPPKFHSNVFPSRVFAAEGTFVQLPCFYQASPRGNSYWRKKTSSLENQGIFDFQSDSSSTLIVDNSSISVLQFHSVEKSDEGIYECIANNKYGTSIAQVQLHIFAPAKMRIKMDKSNANILHINCEIEIDCSEKTCPEALFEWKFNDMPIQKFIEERNNIFRINRSEYIIKKIQSVNDNININPIGVIPQKSLTAKIASKMNALFYKHNKIDEETFIVLNETANKKEISNSFYYSPSILKSLSFTNTHLHRSSISFPSSIRTWNSGRFSCQSTFGVGSILNLAPSTLINFIVTNVRAELVEFEYKSPVLKNDFMNYNFNERGHIDMSGPYVANLSWTQTPNNLTLTEDKIIIGYEVDFRTQVHQKWKTIQFIKNSNSTNLQSTLIHGLMPNQQYQFRIRTKGFDTNKPLTILSASSNWLLTKKSVPFENINEIRHRVLDDSHLILEWDPIETDYSSGNNLRYNISWSYTHINEYDENLYNESIITYENTLLLTIPSPTKKCKRISITIQPLNDMGQSPFSTGTIIHITNEGPKRRAQNAQLTRVNATHLKLTWEWINAGDCENILGTRISCDEISSLFINRTKYASITVSNHNILKEAITNQSVPSHYTNWFVHDLQPSTSYRCRLTPFDQYGRWGSTSVSNIASTNSPAPNMAPEITYIRLKNTENGDFSILMDWTSILLKPESHKENEDNNSALSDENTGYKIFVYASETAENPTILLLKTAQLIDPLNPSARIDNLKNAFRYYIQIAGYNESGTGPKSVPIPVNIATERFDAQYSSNGKCLHYKIYSIVFYSFLFTYMIRLETNLILTQI